MVIRIGTYPHPSLTTLKVRIPELMFFGPLIYTNYRWSQIGTVFIRDDSHEFAGNILPIYETLGFSCRCSNQHTAKGTGWI